MESKNKFSELRKKAEEKLDNVKIEAIQDEEVRELVHELQVHQIELEMQNAELQNANRELKETQEELELSWKEYIDLYDFAPVGYCTFDKDAKVVLANLTLTRYLGVPRLELMNHPFYEHVHPEDKDKFYSYLRKVFDLGTKQVCEIRLLTNNEDDSWFYAKLESILKPESGICRSIISDITEQKEMEEQLRAKAAATSSS
jgi:PAS domain S-box-containing protein